MPAAFPIRGRFYELGIFVTVFAIALLWKGLLGAEWAVVGVVLGGASPSRTLHSAGAVNRSECVRRTREPLSPASS